MGDRTCTVAATDLDRAVTSTPEADLRVVFHLGLPKTATTTLQDNVLATCPHARTHRVVDDPRVSPELRRFAWDLFLTSRIILRETPRWWESPAGQDLRARIETTLDETVASYGSAIVSCELLTSPPAFDPATARLGRPRTGLIHPVPAHLAALTARLRQRSRVEVILTLRNQSDLMAALYAENSRFLARPSQADFERRVLRLLRRERDLRPAVPFLDLDRLVGGLCEVFGAPFVTILLFERLHERETLGRLATALGMEPERFVSAWEDGGRRNVRTVAPGTWSLRPAIPLPNRVGRRLHERGLLRRMLTAGWVIPIKQRLLAGVQPQPSTASSALTGRIRVPTGLREEVRGQYAASNRRLGERLAVDLAPLGY